MTRRLVIFKAAHFFGILFLCCNVQLTYAQNEKSAEPTKKVSRALNIDQIVSAANSGTAKDRRTNSAREGRFNAERNKQSGRLSFMRNERVRQERISDQLDAQVTQLYKQLDILEAALAKELGDLQELFGSIQETAGEAQEDYKTSLISAHYPERSENLRLMLVKMSSATDLVSIDEIEDLWFQLQNEMNEQSNIVKFDAPVTFVSGTEINEDGDEINVFTTQDRTITRVGVFNAVADDDIIYYNNDRGLLALKRQMDSTFISKSNDLQSATSGVTSFQLDPSKGALLEAYVEKPSILEKIQEGGVVGYVILALGFIGLVISAMRIFALTGIANLVKLQAQNINRPSLRNPLGRVIKIFQDNPSSDPESMELKLSEGILKEGPRLNAWIMFIKIIAVVAPLLGLLGTVTGMIQTFQAITLYGAGDPQTMAGGISQALVTTVLGLVVAIPTVFLHWVASSRAKRIEETLDEVASGLVAEQYEKFA